jgi:solute carrier family 25 2-oxodicarboxylate transporter 21
MSIATLPPVTAAAVTVAVTMYPLDIVRALVMAQASGERAGVGQLVSGFYKTHGVTGFLKQGLGPEMIRATFSRAIKFWLQPITHVRVFGKKQSEGTPFTKGLSGAAATIPEILAISPFENAKLAQQLDKEKRFKSSGQVLGHLYKTRGIPGLYTGYFGMQLRQAIWTGGFFASLDVFKSYSEDIFGKKTVMADTLAGFGAGVFGTALNTWTDVVRTSIQKEALAQTFDSSIPRAKFNLAFLLSGPGSVAQTASEIFQARGIAGLYSGFLVKSCYLGGSGALLSVLVPRFKLLWGLPASD